MIILRGQGASGGIEMGKLLFYRKNDCRIEKTYIENREQEIARFQVAREVVNAELQELYAWALHQMGEEDAEIFAAHQMILEDPEFIEVVEKGIQEECLSAEYAVQSAVEHFTRVFANLTDQRIQERVNDIQDIGIRLLGKLSEDGGRSQEDDFAELAGYFREDMGQDKVIVAAADLLPSETVRLDKSKVIGFATRKGSCQSHTAILARNQKFPAVVGLGEQLRQDYDGTLAIIDGEEGVLYIDPDEETMEKMKEKRELLEEQEAALRDLVGKEDITLKGKRIDIFANIEGVKDVEQVKAHDARGIGLFRTEALYLERETLPTEEEQFLEYKAVAEQMCGRTVVIRTMDIGADKQVDYLSLEHEDNPALGYRAIRICLTQTELFKTQLRAIYRASAYGKLAILFPMITSVREVRLIKAILEAVKEELSREGITYDKSVQIGVMIETPAAVMISRELAKEVDFFSIGTNDLTQYTLAVDRQNPKLQDFYDSRHLAVLAMIQMVTDNAHAEGKQVSICGELAADLGMTETLVGMGIDELSVAPGKVLSLRKRIREIE